MAKLTKQDQINALKRSLRSTTRKLGAAMRERDQAIAERDAARDVAPDFGAVMTAARRWHYSEVRSIADEAIDEVLKERDAAHKAGNRMTSDEARDWLTTWVDETIDGHQHVIYTGQAVMLLAASDNDDAYESEIGESTDDASARACCALRADVWEHLEARSDEWAFDDEEPADDDDDGASESRPPE